MKYTTSFYDINNKKYTLEIGSGVTSNIVLSNEPFVTSIESGDSHMYKPAKYSSATIGIVTSDYMFDIYSNTAQENKVVLRDNSVIKWIGYVTPNLYSQGYENPYETIEVEAIDALSTLQYYKYTTVGESKEIVSFTQIINHLLKKCNAYNYFYISDVTQLTSTSNFCLPSKMYISEQNFFDEDNEPMMMQEVLEEICRYLNLTCIADGDSVFFLDYDGIKNGINDYYKFSVGSLLSHGKTTLKQNHNIQISDYAENGAELSLDNTYNKVTVTDSLYSFDSIIPSIWDEDTLENYGGSWSYVQEVNEDGVGGKHKCFFKYLKNKNYKSYYYNKQTLAPTIPPPLNYANTQNYVGATICKGYFDKVTDFNKKYNDINFTNYVLLHVHNTYDGQLRPLFELILNDSNLSFIGSSTYLIIQGNFLFMDRENEMYIMQGYGNKNDDFNPDNLYINCKLKYGNVYWNGTSWTTTDSTFKLQFDNAGQKDHCINKQFPVKNNITWDMGVDGEGYAIPMPNGDEVITGKPTFTLYHPHKTHSSYRCDAVWLSNFDILAKVQNKNKTAEKDSDTEYSNIINEDYVNELEDVKMKICTWDNKECNYSSVCYLDNNKYKYIDNVYNKATKQLLRFEEHVIYRLVNQYSTPSILLTLNLHSKFKIYATVTDRCLSGKQFIIDSINTDYAMAKQTIKLIEKK